MTTTATLLAALDEILHQVNRMDRAVDDATDVEADDRSVLKREVTALRAQADRLMDWLADQQLEQPKN